MVILDTCAIIEMLKPKPTFTVKAKKMMDAGCCILAISFVEIAYKVKLGKLEMSISTRELVKEFGQIDHVDFIDISAAECLDSIELMWEDNRDPADRVITTYAIKNELAIVTSDNKIKSFYRKSRLVRLFNYFHTILSKP